MDDEAEKRVPAKRLGDRLSNLPESLKFQILLNLPTKDVVKTSVLSSIWRNLWRYVPGLSLDHGDFSDHNVFVSFVDSFLGFNSESLLQNFNLWYEWDEYDERYAANLARWINTVVDRKVQNVHFIEGTLCVYEVKMPLSIYTCASLVSLKLQEVSLPYPKSVSLPCVKVIEFSCVQFANNGAFEMLISGCPILESLSMGRSSGDNVLRVCSQSLLSFTYSGSATIFFEDFIEEEVVVAIDAPRLESLQLRDEETDSFIIINNMEALAKVDMDIVFNLAYGKSFDPNDLQKRNVIRNFLLGISRVKDMTIASTTLEVIYNYLKCEPLPVFRNLYSLSVTFYDYKWEMLPILLKSCPNLKSFTLGFSESRAAAEEEEGASVVPGPRQFLTSLEYVKIVEPKVEETRKMNLASYFLENSTILKKLTYCLRTEEENEESIILKKLLAIPRLSSSCQVIVL